MRSRCFVAAARAVLLAAGASPRARDPTLWATVNVCDTAKQPDTIGIRASMPGTPKGARLAMRFRVQYQGRRTTAGATSRAPTRAGAARRAQGRAARVGLELQVRAPARPVTLRGVVQLPLAQGDALPAPAEVATEAGHRSSAGADPAGYSAATCALGS